MGSFVQYIPEQHKNIGEYTPIYHLDIKKLDPNDIIIYKQSNFEIAYALSELIDLFKYYKCFYNPFWSFFGEDKCFDKNAISDLKTILDKIDPKLLFKINPYDVVTEHNYVVVKSFFERLACLSNNANYSSNLIKLQKKLHMLNISHNNLGNSIWSLKMLDTNKSIGDAIEYLIYNKDINEKFIYQLTKTAKYIIKLCETF
jgi:hypothetical protein